VTNTTIKTIYEAVTYYTIGGDVSDRAEFITDVGVYDRGYCQK